jgi:hypothetical protein
MVAPAPNTVATSPRCGTRALTSQAEALGGLNKQTGAIRARSATDFRVSGAAGLRGLAAAEPQDPELSVSTVASHD